MPATANIVQLRQLLGEKFPGLRQFAQPPSARPVPRWPTGVAAVDRALQGGLPKGAVSEWVSSPASSGTALVQQALIEEASRRNQWFALVDACDCFDPAPLDPAALQRLLWVRCQDAGQALKATDLLLRDANLPLVLLDLRLSPPAELRKIPGTIWYRFQRLLEVHTTVLLVTTPSPLVSGTQTRLFFESPFTLQALNQAQAELFSELKLRAVLRGTDAADAEAVPVAKAG